MNTIVHFEIPADDPERAIRFYSQLFGWRIEKAPGDATEYWLIQTGEGEHVLNGGLMRRVVPNQQPVNYVGVASIDEYVEKVKALGGTVIVPKSAVPGVGYLAHFTDTEGNVSAFFQDDPQAQ